VYTIGLTGGIASGKSTISRLLSELGATIIDADAIARAIVVPGQPAWQQIVACFGDQILCADGSINRRKLGDIVFGDTEQRKRLEEITHPAIWRQVTSEIETAAAAGCQVAVLDVPLLLETGWDSKVDAVWVVYVNRVIQIERLMARDSLTQQQAEMRIDSQLSLEEKKKRADAVIDNSGSPDSTRLQVIRLWESLQSDG
jgi:dephospho-CoA kinase